MESLAAILGTVAMAAPMQAPPPPKVVIVPAGFHFANGRVVPGAVRVAAEFPPPTLLNPPVRWVFPDECRT